MDVFNENAPRGARKGEDCERSPEWQSKGGHPLLFHTPQALDRLENILVGLAKSKKGLIDIAVNEDMVGLNMFLLYCVFT